MSYCFAKGNYCFGAFARDILECDILHMQSEFLFRSGIVIYYVSKRKYWFGV